MPLLPNVVVIYLSSIVVLTPTGQFLDCATIRISERCKARVRLLMKYSHFAVTVRNNKEDQHVHILPSGTQSSVSLLNLTLYCFMYQTSTHTTVYTTRNYLPHVQENKRNAELLSNWILNQLCIKMPILADVPKRCAQISKLGNPWPSLFGANVTTHARVKNLHSILSSPRLLSPNVIKIPTVRREWDRESERERERTVRTWSDDEAALVSYGEFAGRSVTSRWIETATNLFSLHPPLFL